DLSAGGGNNGAYVLNNATVHDDGSRDSLIGGAALDWSSPTCSIRIRMTSAVSTLERPLRTFKSERAAFQCGHARKSKPAIVAGMCLRRSHLLQPQAAEAIPAQFHSFGPRRRRGQSLNYAVTIFVPVNLALTLPHSLY